MTLLYLSKSQLYRMDTKIPLKLAIQYLVIMQPIIMFDPILINSSSFKSLL